MNGKYRIWNPTLFAEPCVIALKTVPRSDTHTSTNKRVIH